MRTRSQPISPGGLLSLEDVAPRRTRSTRSGSASRSSAEPAPQPVHPTTQSKSQRTSKKTTTRKTTKTQDEKAPKRTTRKTRTAAKQTSEEPENEVPTQTPSVDNKENIKEVPKVPDSTQSAIDSALSEPNSSELNRKRTHRDISDEDRDGPQTPTANKRRNLGPHGSTPFSRRMTPLSRRISTNAAPYSERLRRRAAESQGRIHKTLFRLPQLIAQNEADRRAMDVPPLGPCIEPPQTSFDFPAEEGQLDNQTSADDSFAPQEPSTPETPQRGWNIRGLFNSVPRSFSRLIPTFGRSPQRTEVQATAQPSSERITRTQALETLESDHAVNTRDVQSGRCLSEQPSSKRVHDLSYSLFPARIDRALYLGDISSTSKTSSKLAEPELHSAEQKALPQSQDLVLNAQGAYLSKDQTPEQATSETKKKRKRSSSPDVIPNPVGASYGMDLDYFCYSSDSEEEAEIQSQQLEISQKTDSPAKYAVRSAIRSERPLSKKVRFDASPENTPSKLRSHARATDPYQGSHFVGMGGAGVTASNSAATAPATPTPASRVDQPSQRHPGFIANSQGTFCLDYDALSDDSGLSGAPSVNVPAPSVVPEVQITQRAETQKSAQSPASRPTPRLAPLPSTPAKVDEEALAKVRSQAEKYKPKTPSGLRTTSRYSSPMTAASSDIPDTASDKKTTEKFGDDQFARDAQWLYENCPSGDLRQLKWPAKQSLQQESLGVSDETVRLVAKIWDDSEVDGGHRAFRQSMEEFGKTLA